MKATSGKIRIVQKAGELVIYTGLITVTGLSLLLCCTLFFYSYESIIQWAAQTYIPLDKLEKFQNLLLTPSRFILLRFITTLSTIIFIVSSYFIWKKVPSFIKEILSEVFILVAASKNVFKKLSKKESYLLVSIFLFIILSRLYFFNKFPLHVDERFTYLYFINKGWIVSALYYPNPNNHVLFSLFCNITALFFSNPLFILRITAFLTGVLMLSGLWLVMRYYFSAFISISTLVLTAFTPPVFSYGIQGRGYSLLLFWTIIAIAATLKIVTTQKIRDSYIILLGCSSILGFYTIPIFLYPFAGITLFLFLFFSPQKSKLIHLTISFTGISIGVVLIYLPILVINGWNAISGNSWVAPAQWETFIVGLLPNLEENASFLWNNLPFADWFILLTSIYLLLLTGTKQLPALQKYWLQLYLWCLWIVLPILFIQRIFLYSRVMIYLFPLQWGIVSIITEKFIQSFRYYRIFIVSCLILYTFDCLTSFYQLTLPKNKGIYNSLDNVSHWLYDHQADGVFVQYYEYGLCILFQYETNHRTIQLDIGADRFSTKKKYNFVVVHKDHPFPASLSMSSYQIVYKDTDATIYQYRH